MQISTLNIVGLFNPLLLVLLLLASGCNSSGSKHIEKSETNGFELVWQDEFDYSGFPDTTKWAYDTEGNDEGWGNNEAQYYTVARDSNVQVENGLLKITAHHEPWMGKQFTSARLVSKADWKYGRVEVNARVPAGRGTWSAIWMMPGGWTFHDGNWPDIGEIDIMEHVGHDMGTVHASAHSKDYQWQKGTQQTATIKVEDISENFHTYAMEWTPDEMYAFVDDSLYFTYKNEGLGESKWPYNKPFYLILNLAVGGIWGGMQGIDSAAFPQILEVDYVRIYQQNINQE